VQEDTVDRSLAEEYLLLTLDPDTGRSTVDSTRLRAAVAGAAVAQLTLDGALALDRPNDKRATLRRTGTAEPGGALLQEVLGIADGRRPKDAVSRLGGASAWKDRAGRLRDELLAGLAASGVLRREDDRVLGLFPRTRWTVVDAAVVDGLRRQVTEALREGGPAPSTHTVGLVALLAATDRLAAVTGLPKREAKQRAEVVTAGDWAAPAVRAAVQEVNAVLAASVAASTVAATAATS
jgi:Golgi phosphoprotein 3 GPP34